MPTLELKIRLTPTDTFDVEIDDEETVEALGVVIYSMRPELGEELRILHKGRILKPDALLSACSISKGDAIAVAKVGTGAATLAAIRADKMPTGIKVKPKAAAPAPGGAGGAPAPIAPAPVVAEPAATSASQAAPAAEAAKLHFDPPSRSEEGEPKKKSPRLEGPCSEVAPAAVAAVEQAAPDEFTHILTTMKTSDLRKRAAGLGAAQDDLILADDSVAPRRAYNALILKLRNQGNPPADVPVAEAPAAEAPPATEPPAQQQPMSLAAFAAAEAAPMVTEEPPAQQQPVSLAAFAAAEAAPMSLAAFAAAEAAGRLDTAEAAAVESDQPAAEPAQPFSPMPAAQAAAVESDQPAGEAAQPSSPMPAAPLEPIPAAALGEEAEELGSPAPSSPSKPSEPAYPAVDATTAAGLLAFADLLEGGKEAPPPEKLVEILREAGSRMAVMESGVKEFGQALQMINMLSVSGLRGGMAALDGTASADATPSSPSQEDSGRSFMIKRGDSELQEAHQKASAPVYNRQISGGALSSTAVSKEDMDKQRKARLEKLEKQQADKHKEKEDAGNKERARAAMFERRDEGKAKPKGPSRLP